ncbi:MAG: cyclic nucleotide-binding domain-containing protein [Gammaproteobacteria bacterium]|nr:cyclic nucleotide-binding domain-containing protein [Gammaproteobacteria bacterium]
MATCDALQDDALQVIEGLASSTMCAGLDHDDLFELSTLAALRRYKALDEAVAEGSPLTSLQVVCSGRFIVLLPSHSLRNFRENTTVSLASFVPGDSLGVDGLAMAQKADVSVIASEAATTVELPLVPLIELLERKPALGARLYRNLLINHQRDRTAAFA